MTMISFFLLSAWAWTSSSLLQRSMRADSFASFSPFERSVSSFTVEYDVQLVKNPPAMQETLVQFLEKICWRRDRLPTLVFLRFSCGSAGKESTCNVGDLGSIPGLGRYPGEAKGYPLQYSGLENSMDCRVSGVGKSRTRLSDFHFHFQCFSEMRCE